VTYNTAGRDGNVYCIQDATGGIFIEAPHQQLEGMPGDVVEVSGFTTFSTGYAPAVIQPTIRIVGKAHLPHALHLSFSQLASGANDGLLVNITGFVRSISRRDGSLVFRLEVGDEVVDLFVPEMTRWESEALVGATLKIDAVCSNLFNAKNQLNGVEFYVPRRENIAVIQRPDRNPFLIPPTRIDSLMLFPSHTGTSAGKRVHLHGTVTYAQGSLLYLWDGTGGIAIHRTETAPVLPGAAVDVIGFPAVGAYSPILTDAQVRKAGLGKMPKPVISTTDEARSGVHDGQVITVTALLDGDESRRDNSMLLLESRQAHFVATFPDQSSAAGLDLATASVLQLTGICSSRSTRESNPFRFGCYYAVRMTSE
jgi:hypothetical protein